MTLRTGAAIRALQQAWHPADRQVRGEKHPQAKLTDAQVAEIRARYQRGMGEKLGREFGVTATHVLRIVAGKKR